MAASQFKTLLHHFQIRTMITDENCFSRTTSFKTIKLSITKVCLTCHRDEYLLLFYIVMSKSSLNYLKQFHSIRIAIPNIFTKFHIFANLNQLYIDDFDIYNYC